MSDLKGHISAKGLTKTFGSSVAVAGVDFTIPAGSYCCLLGPSGCGKTTTLRMISGHDSQTSGTIAIDAQDLGIIPPAQRPTAMMFQNYALFPHMTVEDNVAFSLRVKGTDRAVRRQRAGHLLEVVELTDYAQRKPNELSGGQQQRVALARALMMNPSVLALDEPLLHHLLRDRRSGEGHYSNSPRARACGRTISLRLQQHRRRPSGRS